MQFYVVFDLEQLQRGPIGVGCMPFSLQNTRLIFSIEQIVTLVNQETIECSDC